MWHGRLNWASEISHYKVPDLLNQSKKLLCSVGGGCCGRDGIHLLHLLKFQPRKEFKNVSPSVLITKTWTLWRIILTMNTFSHQLGIFWAPSLFCSRRFIMLVTTTGPPSSVAWKRLGGRSSLKRKPPGCQPRTRQGGRVRPRLIEGTAATTASQTWPRWWWLERRWTRPSPKLTPVRDPSWTPIVMIRVSCYDNTTYTSWLVDIFRLKCCDLISFIFFLKCSLISTPIYKENGNRVWLVCQTNLKDTKEEGFCS